MHSCLQPIQIGFEFICFHLSSNKNKKSRSTFIFYKNIPSTLNSPPLPLSLKEGDMACHPPENAFFQDSKSFSTSIHPLCFIRGGSRARKPWSAEMKWHVFESRPFGNRFFLKPSLLLFSAVASLETTSGRHVFFYHFTFYATRLHSNVSCRILTRQVAFLPCSHPGPRSLLATPPRVQWGGIWKPACGRWTGIGCHGALTKRSMR